VVTGGGAKASALKIIPLRMAEITRAEWIDVARQNECSREG
jgi:hypothetical protein